MDSRTYYVYGGRIECVNELITRITCVHVYRIRMLLRNNAADSSVIIFDTSLEVGPYYPSSSSVVRAFIVKSNV